MLPQCSFFLFLKLKISSDVKKIPPAQSTGGIYNETKKEGLVILLLNLQQQLLMVRH